MEHRLGHVGEFPDRNAVIVEAGGRSIGVFNVDGRFYAVKNVCPHKQAPICRGTLEGTMLPTDTPGHFEYGREDMVLKCPWHGWEFDLPTGECLFGVSDRRVKVYPVEVRDGQVYLEIGAGGVRGVHGVEA